MPKRSATTASAVKPEPVRLSELLELEGVTWVQPVCRCTGTRSLLFHKSYGAGAGDAEWLECDVWVECCRCLGAAIPQ
jgi:hypothetical protein